MEHDWIIRAFSAVPPNRNLLAAAHLRHMGADGIACVPTLFQMCCELHDAPDPHHADRGFVLSGMRSVGAVLNACGFDSTNVLHTEILNWTIDLTQSQDNDYRATGIWVLGEIGIPPESVRDRLIEMLCGQRHRCDHEISTCRSIAFRMLARADLKTASLFTQTEACKEYIASMDHWLARNASRPDGHYDHGAELEAEVAWLRNDRVR